jgi:hypothetical protein
LLGFSDPIDELDSLELELESPELELDSLELVAARESLR